MAHRYRLYSTEEQSVFMLERHCADARFVWNLAVEQFNWGGSGRSAPGSAERMHQLAEARREFEWLRRGSSAVQQQALRDFDWAVKEFFNGTRGRPTWRKKHHHEGFCVRDTKVRVHSRKWAEIAVPKLGWVRFQLSRALPPGALGMARVTRDKAGRWHVSFPGPQRAVADAGRSGRSIGIDRGVATTIATSDGQMMRAPAARERKVSAWHGCRGHWRVNASAAVVVKPRKPRSPGCISGSRTAAATGWRKSPPGWPRTTT